MDVIRLTVIPAVTHKLIMLDIGCTYRAYMYIPFEKELLVSYAVRLNNYKRWKPPGHALHS